MGNFKFSFERLDVWQLAKDFVLIIYKITKQFPQEEKFGLGSQINRASVSVASNIAEGSSRTSKKDQAHFTQIAYGSLMEVACQIIIAHELGYITKEDYENLRDRIEVISNKLNALRKYQLGRIS